MIICTTVVLKSLRKLMDGSLPDVIIGRTYKESLPHRNDYLFDKCIVNNTNPDQLIKHINKVNYPTVDCWTYIVKAEFIQSNNISFIDARIGENEYFVLQILCLMKSYLNFNSDFYWHRKRTGTLSNLTGYLGACSYLVVFKNMVTFERTNQFDLERKKYIDNRIKSVLGSLVLQTTFLEKEDILRLSVKNRLLLKELKNKLIELKIIKNLDESSDEILDSLNNYFAKKTLLNLSSSNKKIYIYCLGLHSQASMKVMLNNGYIIHGVLDDSCSSTGEKILGVEIHKPSVLFKLNDLELKNLVCIVSIPSKKTFLKILNNLKKYKLNTNQVIHDSVTSKIGLI